MACQMAATAVTLNDFEGHSPVACLFKCNRRTFVQHFAGFPLTVCSHGSSALAGLLVTASFASAVYATESLSVRPSVCLFVHHSDTPILCQSEGM